MILVCGPTGSGKTTTLHSALRELGKHNLKIWTAEDPVEITQPHLSQVQVSSKQGWTFGAAMRAFLRADPDVIMVGEMRDKETIGTAIEAALTGHLVLSTLHTNSAPATVRRLLDMDIDPFTLSDSLLLVLSQRLVHRLCNNCKQDKVATRDTLYEYAQEYYYTREGGAVPQKTLDMQVEKWIEQYGDPKTGEVILKIRNPKGCPACKTVGFSGRLGIHELLVNHGKIPDLIRKQSGLHDFQNEIKEQGLLNAKQDGIEKVLQGLTDIHEVRVAVA